MLAHETVTDLIPDADQLQYISSAGLRVILRLLKTGKQIKMVNVSPEVYEVLDVTGFSEMMSVEKAFRKVSIDGCEVIGQGSNSTVYELINARSITKLILAAPEKMDEYVAVFVDTLKLIHHTAVKPGELPSMKDVALDWADYLKGHIPQEQQEKLHALIAAVPEHPYMLHGDYHSNHVMVQDGEPLLIDMDTLCVGHPVFELASAFNAYVGFGEIDPNVTLRFMKMDAETAHAVWNQFLPLYLDSEDDAYIQAVAEKAMVVGCTRLLRRTLRREADTEHGKACIAYYKQRLGELLERVDTLVF